MAAAAARTACATARVASEADLGAWLCWEDESGRRPPKGRTWGRRGHTPVVKVTGGHDTRVSLAALTVRPSCPRLIFRTHRARRADNQGPDGLRPVPGPPAPVGWPEHPYQPGERELIPGWLTAWPAAAYRRTEGPPGLVEPKRSLATWSSKTSALTELVKTRLRRCSTGPASRGPWPRPDSTSRP